MTTVNILQEPNKAKQEEISDRDTIAMESISNSDHTTVGEILAQTTKKERPTSTKAPTDKMAIVFKKT